MREKCKAFKKDLACVFDDNLHTKKWHNIVDWVIIALILISSLEIFLSTFEDVSEQYGGVLRFMHFTYMGGRCCQSEICRILGARALLL